MVARALNLARTQPVVASAATIAVVGILTILGAYYFQYVLGYRPCPLCLEQRLAYYVTIPLAAMILLRLSVGPSHKVITLALLSIAAAMLWNAGLGVYHSGVEWQWWPGPQDCSGAAPDFFTGGSLIDQINRTRVVRCDEAALALPRPVARGLQCADLAGAGSCCAMGRGRRLEIADR